MTSQPESESLKSAPSSSPTQETPDGWSRPALTVTRLSPSSSTTGSEEATRWRTGSGSSQTISPVAPSALAAMEAISKAPNERAARKATEGWLAHCLGSPPVAATRSVYGDDGQFEGLEVISVRLPETDDAARDLAWSGIRPLMSPARNSEADQRSILAELGKTWSVMARRPADGVETELALETFADDLSDLPADIVIRALQFWRRAEKWRPTVSEIRREAQVEARYRRALWRAFKGSDA